MISHGKSLNMTPAKLAKYPVMLAATPAAAAIAKNARMTLTNILRYYAQDHRKRDHTPPIAQRLIVSISVRRWP
jgi:hypothetical protein